MLSLTEQRLERYILIILSKFGDDIICFRGRQETIHYEVTIINQTQASESF